MGKKTVKCFYDFEFTGLHQHTTPISLGVVSSSGHEFYAEFTDYNHLHVDEWLQKNVIDNLMFRDMDAFEKTLGSVTFVKGTFEKVGEVFRKWLSQYKFVEFWSDCGWYDGVLLNELLGGAFNLPENVNYIYFDIAPLFRIYGLDPDVHRETFIDEPIEGDKHNSLYDAKVIEACYNKLYRNRDRYLKKIY